MSQDSFPRPGDADPPILSEVAGPGGTGGPGARRRRVRPAPPLSAGAKVAIGCGVLFGIGLIAAVCVIAFLGVRFAKWMEGQEEHIRNICLDRGTPAGDAMARARALPYDRPADGAIDEERLLVFLAIRDDLLLAWRDHEGIFVFDFEGEAPPDIGVGELVDRLGSMWADWSAMITAYASALEAHGMHPDEYLDVLVTVYGPVPERVPFEPPPQDDAADAADAAARQPLVRTPANEALIAAHRERIDAVAMPEMDAVLHSDTSDLQEFEVGPPHFWREDAPPADGDEPLPEGAEGR